MQGLLGIEHLFLQKLGYLICQYKRQHKAVEELWDANLINILHFCTSLDFPQLCKVQLLLISVKLRTVMLMGIFLLGFLAGPRKDEEMVCMPFSHYGMYFLVFSSSLVLEIILFLDELEATRYESYIQKFDAIASCSCSWLTWLKFLLRKNEMEKIRWTG